MFDRVKAWIRKRREKPQEPREIPSPYEWGVGVGERTPEGPRARLERLARAKRAKQARKVMHARRRANRRTF